MALMCERITNHGLWSSHTFPYLPRGLVVGMKMCFVCGWLRDRLAYNLRVFYGATLCAVIRIIYEYVHSMQYIKNHTLCESQGNIKSCSELTIRLISTYHIKIKAIDAYDYMINENIRIKYVCYIIVQFINIVKFETFK